MLVGANKNLEDHILEVLSLRKETTVTDIEEHLKKKNRHATEQGIYRILRKLQQEGVIIKHKKFYGLRLAWLLELSALVDQMENTYLKESYLQQFLPANGKQHTWHFHDLFKMTSFWSQLLLAIAKNSTTKISFNYSPHLWYVPLQAEQEEQFMNTYFREIKKAYMIVGSRSPFDKHTLTVMNKHNTQEERYLASTSSEHISKNPSDYLDIIDDYIVSIKLSPKATKAIEELCEKATPLRPDELYQIHKMCNKDMKSKIILKNNHQKAEIYRKKFKKIFGPISVSATRG